MSGWMISRVSVMQNLFDDIQQETLQAVLTVPEVCGFFHKTEKTVIELVKEGKLSGRQASYG